MGGYDNDLMEGSIPNSIIWIIIKPDEYLDLEVWQNGVLEREGGWL